MPEAVEKEIPLIGGTANRGHVVRVGDTVRRPLRATSPAAHALLRHLADAGFDGAPRFLGVDGSGREILSYIPGVAITRPYPAWALTDTALRSVATLLRSYHQAVSTFDPTPHTWPSPPTVPFAGVLVSHNDVNLDNVVFRDGQAVALIDFDLASPGCRVWDVACAARLWAPVRPESDIDDLRRGRAMDRLRLFVDSYGLDRGARELLVTAILQNHRWCYDIVGTAAARGHAAFCEYWTGGGMERAKRTERWYVENVDLLREVLLRQPDERAASSADTGSCSGAPVPGVRPGLRRDAPWHFGAP